jgi:hypothetical protein
MIINIEGNLHPVNQIIAALFTNAGVLVSDAG